VRFISRRNNDLSKRFPELQSIQVPVTSAIIDGEIVAIDEQGLPCFDDLRRTRPSCPVVFYAFDLLSSNKEDLRSLPLLKRKALLKRIVPKSNHPRSADAMRFSNENGRFMWVAKIFEN